MMTPTLLRSVPARAGTRLVFTQTDDLASVHGPFVEIRPTAENVTDYLAAHGAALLAALKAAELGADLADVIVNGSLASPTLRYVTFSEAGAFIRAFYQGAARQGAIMLGDYLNTLTDAQLRNLFSMTQAQVTNLRTNKLQPAATQAAAIRSATGA